MHYLRVAVAVEQEEDERVDAGEFLPLYPSAVRHS